QRQLSVIGNNINQIARQVNSSEIKAGDSLQIISYLSSIDENLKQIRQSWSVQK
ncbi:plasmid mobilization relaxosome protein MobC, partial [Pseudoalteromonas sp. 43-MNA-CIBAN-0464]|uniref:plasmid mobilization relaxosome protein MobC n=1 Tax=Pseudoalteromonas sp. 43-MNA-CIBAN-0464 TaxID=3140425 RepID=UPI0033297887